MVDALPGTVGTGPGQDSQSRNLNSHLSELAGAFGDFGTIIPLVLAVAVVCRLPLAPILLFFGIWYIATGGIYHLPIPVEPMKAVAAIAIAEQLGGGEIAAAGIVLGVLFLVIGSDRWMTAIARFIPEGVLRGIQLALALLLIKTAAGFLTEDPYIFAFALAIILAGLALSWRTRFPDLSAIVVVVLGIILGIVINGFPGFHLFELPTLVIPTTGDTINALTQLVVPQAILTVTNAVLATSLLAKDLFHREVPPQKLSRTIGLMNLISVPFGGFPMCHGAGGLAGQYRFGARTGLANIVAGIFFLALALFFASQAMLTLIPVGIFGALLLFSALELGKHGLKRDSWAIAGLMGAIAVISSMTAAFVVGMVVAYAMVWYQERNILKI
jgi:MFS superfamily sulfate permease-like transporter